MHQRFKRVDFAILEQNSEFTEWFMSQTRYRDFRLLNRTCRLLKNIFFHRDLKRSKENDDPIKEISLSPIVPEQLKMTRPRAFRIQ